MSFLDVVLQVFAWLLIVVPIAILVIGVILFHYSPVHRKTVGIILLTLGSLELALYSLTFYFTFTLRTSNLRAIGFSSILLVVEVSTVIIGIVSMIKKPLHLKSI